MLINGGENMVVSVIIPTFKRTNDLSRCLAGISKQTILPDEVLIVVRNTDQETLHFLKHYQTNFTIKPSIVERPGQVAALNKGLQSSAGEILCILDDDTIPHVHWLEKIVENFNMSDKIGGVGGRDWVYHGDKREEGKKDIVGKVQWFGRVIGNHHLGYGTARDVDVLKGANMSYRKEAIKGLSFDERLLGNGAQVHNDMAFSLSVKKKGWRLVYDPEVAVDHFPAQRFDLDQRDLFNQEAYYNGVYNETLILSDYYQSQIKKYIYLTFCFFIGTSVRPGVLQFFRLIGKEHRNLALRKFMINVRTRIEVESKHHSLKGEVK